MADAQSPANLEDRFKTEFEAHTLGRDDAIPLFKNKKRRKKKFSKKALNNNKKRKKAKNVKFEEDQMENLETTDPMKKLYAAHPRHVIKLILKKLCQKPSFYRMLGSLGMALKSSGISLEEFFLSSSNKLPKSSIRDKLRYDINDERMLILARLAVHKMLIREGTTLKSAIHTNGTYPMEYDSDDDNEEINELPPQHRSLKKGLKYINNDQFAEKMQSTNPQDILNALSYGDKHRLYSLFKQDLDNIDEKDGGPTELHKYCIAHVNNPPQLIENAIPTIIKYDDQTTWPKIIEPVDPRLMEQESVYNDGGDIINDNIDNDDDEEDIEHDLNGITKVSASTLGVPNRSIIGMNSAKSNFTSPSAKSIYGSEYRENDNDNDNDDINDFSKSRRSLPGDGNNYNDNDDEMNEMTEIQRKEREAQIKRERIDLMNEEYKDMIERDNNNITRNVLSRDHDSIIQNPYEYYLDFSSWSSPSKDISLLSSLQTQIDILVRYNHIGYKHLSMLLLNSSNLPEMYVSLDRMREWELNRDNEIEILENKRIECKSIYGGDIDELNIRKALLAREINESKVSLERIKYELKRMRQLYENAKLELDEVNEVTKQQELQRDAYLTKFDEKWTFEWPVRAQFHRQTKLNDKIKQDAKEWNRKLEDLKKYNDSDEIWEKLIENIWKFGNDNKKMMGHYNKLNHINTSRSIIYNGCITFWNTWYFNHCQGIFDHNEDKKMLSNYYKDIMLRGTENNIDFEINKDRAQFEYEWNDNDENAGIWSYRDHIYKQREKGQIDITATDLDASELWRLVEYQEHGDFDSYKQFAYPKLYKFEQEQLEIERKEILKELEKQKEKKKSKLLHSKKTKRNLLRAAKKQEKLNKLQEEDEEYEREEEKQYQSQMNMLMNNEFNTTYRSQPGTPLFNSLHSHSPSLAPFQSSKPGTPIMSSIGIGASSMGMSMGMSKTSIINGTNNRIASPSNFGRQRTGTVSTPTYYNYGSSSTPISNNYNNYGTQTTLINNNNNYGTQTTFINNNNNNYGTQTTFKPSTPSIDEMGASLSKFGGGLGGGLDSPQTPIINQQDSISKFDANRNSFSIITPHQKHDKL